ncbi:GNAT family N-acetyltransferase [Candidatus Bathyarchaeota archaeon]|nr:GNAT family N-acetyltransferase [Candidatus Bathyarchaeota archaeon]
MNSKKETVLKNGRVVSIRSYLSSDKESLVSMYAGLSPESLRWSMPPYNRQRIERWTSNLENSIIIVAVEKDRIVGHLQISIGTSAPFRDIGDLFIYIHQDYQNLGLGAALMNEGLRLAHARHLHRVELTVVADNHRAVKLYEKVGFQREGVKRENYRGENGRYHDEVIMGILL